MTEWWTSLDLFMKIVWCIALGSSLVFIVQSIMSFAGADHDIDADIDTDFDASTDVDVSMNLYTFRNLIVFLLGLSWTIVLLRPVISSTLIILLIAVIVGAAMVTGVMFLFKWLSSMQQSGNINVYNSAVGCFGKVYLPIPAHRAGTGKIQITINNAVREYEAITDGEALSTGTSITVVEVIDASTMLVEPAETLIV
ncbi:MAG: hypothetical protein ACI3ZQ_09440 [Candidatus Cryptobacteroides sp.]